jgi:hypothetical protein
MMKYRFMILVVVLSILPLLAQDAVKSDVHLFQTFLRDAPISKTGYGEVGFVYGDYDYASTWGIGVQGGYPINPKIELGAQWGFVNFSPEVGDGQSGISDLTVAGRYLIIPANLNFSAGGYLTLPIGSEDVGQGNLDFGAFGALRYPLNNGMVITGVLGLDFIETTEVTYDPITYETKEETSHESSILIGGGAIYPINEQFHAIGELNFHTEGDYALLSGGVDYSLAGGSRIRGGLGIGLDDGAPDFMLMASFLLFLR